MNARTTLQGVLQAELEHFEQLREAATRDPGAEAYADAYDYAVNRLRAALGQARLEPDDVARCRVCGCTDDHACVLGTPQAEAESTDGTPLEGVILPLQITTENGVTVTTWRCPHCQGTVRAHTGDPDKALEYISRYAPHRYCPDDSGASRSRSPREERP